MCSSFSTSCSESSPTIVFSVTRAFRRLSCSDHSAEVEPIPFTETIARLIGRAPSGPCPQGAPPPAPPFRRPKVLLGRSLLLLPARRESLCARLPPARLSSFRRRSRFHIRFFSHNFHLLSTNSFTSSFSVVKGNAGNGIFGRRSLCSKIPAHARTHMALRPHACPLVFQACALPGYATPAFSPITSNRSHSWPAITCPAIWGMRPFPSLSSQACISRRRCVRPFPPRGGSRPPRL